MKRIISFLFIFSTFILNAQNYPFTEKWNHIENQLRDGHLKSVEPVLDEVYVTAKKENQYEHLIKALIIKSIISVQTSDNEDIVTETENNFLQEIAKAEGVEKSILQSLLAELYFNYYQENRYRIINRTDLNAEGSGDFRTWDASRFLKEIDEQLQASIQPKNLLSQTNVKEFNILLEGETKWRFLRPSLYDLLANRALNFYQNHLFEQQEFDQTIKNQRIENLYANLVEINKNKDNPSALIEAELQKIKYDFADQMQSEKYRSSLEKLLYQYQGEEWSTNIIYELALTYANLSEIDNNYIKALELCNQAIKQFPNSHGSAKCKHLKETILTPSLSLETDDSFLADEYNPLYITHKNIDKIYYRVYTISPNEIRKFENGFNYDYKTEEFIINKSAKKTGNIQLKDFNDYKTHSTKIPFEPLEAGNYILLFSTNQDFSSKNKQPLFQNVIISTNIDLSTRQKKDNYKAVSNIQILNKKTGLPLKNEKIEVYESYRKNPYNLIVTKATDSLGRIEIKTNEKESYYRNYRIKTNAENTYIPFKQPYNYNRNREIKESKETVFFTDRSIYRPGQTVYFKSILYSSLGNQNKIAKNEDVTITIKDVNGEEISKLMLKTNDFGSVHGEFILPSSGITGRYIIRNSWSNEFKYIQVEEYKRPKFETEIKPLREIYTLNNNIKVEGRATTFSGANVSEAKVVYRVFRQAYNPFYWWRSYNNDPDVEITQGETFTNNKGDFTFEFKALPAKPKNDKNNRAYRYKIVADVTDISGETHSAESSVRIGDIPFQINLDLDERISTNKLDSIQIVTTNLNGEKTGLKGNLKITKIEPLDRVLRQQQRIVEYELVDKKEWIKNLPYIAYENDHLIENRKRGKTILNQSWDTSNSEFLSLNSKIPAGIYEVKATSVYKKDTIETARVIEIFDDTSSINQQTYFSTNINKKEFEPGETAEITFNSDANNTHVLVELEANGKIIKKDFLSLEKNNTYSIPIKEEYRGNIFVHTYFTKFNQVISQTLSIEVPFNNKKLDITASTLRNKLKPGQEETWELSIKDAKGDQFLAEVLAGMYDKSLDQFKSNPWNFSAFSNNYSSIPAWRNKVNNYFRNFSYYRMKNEFPYISYEDFNLFGLELNENRFNFIRIRGVNSATVLREERISAPQAIAEDAAEKAEPGSPKKVDLSALKRKSNGLAYETVVPVNSNQQDTEKKLDNIQARKNLEETAFFFPNLKTDKDGNIKIQFTTPESLTTWNFQAIAHTQDLKVGTFQSDIITQKELMVVPNAPRFLREGDVLKFKSKIINLSEKDLSGKAKLLLFDAFTMQPIDGKFDLTNTEQNFEVNAGGNTTVTWTLSIPKVDEVQSVVYRVVAASDKFSDGEENALPILTNRTLVTETLPMSVRENQTKTFSFDRLKNTTSSTRDDFKLTMEMTTNPIWYAVMALPYLREYPFECSEQVFARFYGNVISQNIVNSNPKIKAVFDDWNQKDQLISPLEKNEALKNILLAETPWVREAQNESEQMKRIAVLFDLNKMRQELKETYQKLEHKQSSSGGFPWFEGGKDNFYITTHIVAGFGHLENMGMNLKDDFGVDSQHMLSQAIGFIDEFMKKEWDKYKADTKNYHLNKYNGLYWLYARSFHLKKAPLNASMQVIKDYFLNELEQDKFKQNIQTQAMLSLVLHRYGKTSSAKDLIFAIKDRAVESDEMGMYWKENVSGYRWNEAPVETQALLIEAFDEITPDDLESIESMKVWLLKNKQTNQWNTTKATTEAVYALMNTGKNWAHAEDGITIEVGNQVWYSKDIKPTQDVQSGSGYVKESWDKSEIKPEMGTVKINKTSPGVAWGAMYWQYFEDLDKISGANTNVKFNKQLFIQRNTNQGPKLFEIKPNSPIQVGDLVKVRLEIQTDRAMEFVHIKDMRASGFEPVNVISQYQWQDGLGYYESTLDAATNFFIDYLPKGVYVFEYDLRANNAGIFSNGITQMQNMYAPEFTAHSEGIKVEIE